jgi:integrase
VEKSVEAQRQKLLNRLQAPGGIQRSHGAPRSLKQAVKAYILDLRGTGKLAMERQAEYALKEWTAWPHPTREDIVAWFEKQRENDLSERTIKSRYIILKHFFKYAEIAVPNMPPTPKVKKTSPRVADDGAFAALLASCDDYTRVLIEMARQLGLRKQELMFAAWTDISWETSSFYVTEKPDVGFTIKNRKERVQPMSPSLVKLLKEWQAVHPGRFILGTRTGKPAQSLLNKLKAEVIKAGLNKKEWQLHMLRRKYGTFLHTNGTPLAMVSKLLGHANITTTELYLGVDGRKEQAEHVTRVFG